ncbi:MAG: heat shock protein HspQ [Chromatiaceae bacterium]|nr:heat shock protein HspQ [Gammaproteobacteria bacterium]MCP5317117.1 heat shock protein HspQ [Chromatiaceae bacterium]MCW5586873.1 heat shock protein HspQ [Chromatiales bacterium]MCP5436391.1 heat shock protein HspQ [Chromatiaceae bacterium]MCP5437991.1 heat shock protein HspQ [Chromatiaceae bacterium]
MTVKPKFFVGQIVHHNRFDYRGVIVDVDASFQGTESWYDQVARSRPPKDQPWYRILVDGIDQETYVAERHLEPAPDTTPVSHPELLKLFNGFADGVYQHRTH